LWPTAFAVPLFNNHSFIYNHKDGKYNVFIPKIPLTITIYLLFYLLGLKWGIPLSNMYNGKNPIIMTFAMHILGYQPGVKLVLSYEVNQKQS
jgi:hypothetical protein